MSKAKAVSTNRVKKSREDWIFDIILYTIGVLLIIITLYPMYFIVIASFSDPAAVIPAGIVFEGKLRFRSKVTVKYGKPIAPEDIQLEKELDPHKLKAVKVKIMGEIKELV